MVGGGPVTKPVEKQINIEQELYKLEGRIPPFALSQLKELKNDIAKIDLLNNNVLVTFKEKESRDAALDLIRTSPISHVDLPPIASSEYSFGIRFNDSDIKKFNLALANLEKNASEKDLTEFFDYAEEAKGTVNYFRSKGVKCFLVGEHYALQMSDNLSNEFNTAGIELQKVGNYFYFGAYRNVDIPKRMIREERGIGSEKEVPSTVPSTSTPEFDLNKFNQDTADKKKLLEKGKLTEQAKNQWVESYSKFASYCNNIITLGTANAIKSLEEANELSLEVANKLKVSEKAHVEMLNKAKETLTDVQFATEVHRNVFAMLEDAKTDPGKLRVLWNVLNALPKDSTTRKAINLKSGMTEEAIDAMTNSSDAREKGRLIAMLNTPINLRDVLFPPKPPFAPDRTTAGKIIFMKDNNKLKELNDNLRTELLAYQTNPAKWLAEHPSRPPEQAPQVKKSKSFTGPSGAETKNVTNTSRETTRQTQKKMSVDSFFLKLDKVETNKQFELRVLKSNLQDVNDFTVRVWDRADRIGELKDKRTLTRGKNTFIIDDADDAYAVTLATK